MWTQMVFYISSVFLSSPCLVMSNVCLRPFAGWHLQYVFITIGPKNMICPVHLDTPIIYNGHIVSFLIFYHMYQDRSTGSSALSNINFRRRLTGEQRMQVLETCSKPTALYMKLACDTALRWKSFSENTHEELRPTATELIIQLFERYVNPATV